MQICKRNDVSLSATSVVSWVLFRPRRAGGNFFLSRQDFFVVAGRSFTVPCAVLCGLSGRFVGRASLPTDFSQRCVGGRGERPCGKGTWFSLMATLSTAYYGWLMDYNGIDITKWIHCWLRPVWGGPFRSAVYIYMYEGGGWMWTIVRWVCMCMCNWRYTVVCDFCCFLWFLCFWNVTCWCDACTHSKKKGLGEVHISTDSVRMCASRCQFP